MPSPLHRSPSLHLKMSGVMKMTKSPVLWLPLLILHCCTANDLPCTVSQEADGRTTYRIPDFNQWKCQIQWFDGDMVVLANQEEHNNDNVLFNNETTLIKVLFNNETTLVTRTCMNTSFYMRNCISEGIPQTATCNANCTGRIVPENGPHTYEIVLYVAVVLMILVIIGVAVCLMRSENVAERARTFLRVLCPNLLLCPNTTGNYAPTPGRPEDVIV